MKTFQQFNEEVTARGVGAGLRQGINKAARVQPITLEKDSSQGRQDPNQGLHNTVVLS